MRISPRGTLSETITMIHVIIIIIIIIFIVFFFFSPQKYFQIVRAAAHKPPESFSISGPLPNCHLSPSPPPFPVTAPHLAVPHP